MEAIAVDGIDVEDDPWGQLAEGLLEKELAAERRRRQDIHIGVGVNRATAALKRERLTDRGQTALETGVAPSTLISRPGVMLEVSWPRLPVA